MSFSIWVYLRARTQDAERTGIHDAMISPIKAIRTAATPCREAIYVTPEPDRDKSTSRTESERE